MPSTINQAGGADNYGTPTGLGPSPGPHAHAHAAADSRVVHSLLSQPLSYGRYPAIDCLCIYTAMGQEMLSRPLVSVRWSSSQARQMMR